MPDYIYKGAPLLEADVLKLAKDRNQTLDEFLKENPQVKPKQAKTSMPSPNAVLHGGPGMTSSTDSTEQSTFSSNTVMHGGPGMQTAYSPASTDQTTNDSSVETAFPVITYNTIGKEEEEAQLELKNMFPYNEYGFEFEQSGVGDNITVTSADGKKKEFEFDNMFDWDDKGVAKEMTKWLENNKKSLLASSNDIQHASAVELEQAIGDN